MPKPKTETSENSEEQRTEGQEEEGLGLNLALDKKSSKETSSSLFGDKDEPEEETSAADKPKKKQEKETEESEDEETEETQEEETEESEETEPTPEEVAAFTPREKGLYNAVKKERKARQEMEAKLDFIELQTKYGPKTKTEKTEKAAETEEAPVDPLDELLASKGPEDFITAAELSAALKKQKELENKAKTKKADKEAEFETRKQQIQEETDAAEKVMQGRYSDFKEAAHYAEQLIQKHPPLLQNFLNLSFNKSPMEAVKWLYELGKDHRDFGTGKYGKNPKDNNKRKEIKKVIENAEKKNTSASTGPGDKTPARFSTDELENMDPEELGSTLANMPEEQLWKVPRRIRKKALQALND